ncbi:transcription factor RF2a-like [Rosa chinensis]|uniref:transcription factor RF2a-like n=1 Tax=Rosa chinensis TaxID=74649 RepID=UPI001AD8AB79|nr:transcription factor RF2a-like [Rosa chinensis]
MGIATTRVTIRRSMCRRTSSTQNEDVDIELTMLVRRIERLESIRADLSSQLAASQRDINILQSQNEVLRNSLDHTVLQLQQDQALNDEITRQIEELKITTGEEDPKTPPS